jgi:hypothetical protein
MLAKCCQTVKYINDSDHIIIMTNLLKKEKRYDKKSKKEIQELIDKVEHIKLSSRAPAPKLFIRKT